MSVFYFYNLSNDLSWSYNLSLEAKLESYCFCFNLSFIWGLKFCLNIPFTVIIVSFTEYSLHWFDLSVDHQESTPPIGWKPSMTSSELYPVTPEGPPLDHQWEGGALLQHPHLVPPMPSQSAHIGSVNNFCGLTFNGYSSMLLYICCLVVLFTCIHTWIKYRSDLL